ncbi:hypothetical protein [Heliobacterium mobile]|uniref:hypothetical protein n=1 Tax=Heliobacterium mobile TaxID=28064 RepID=UPI001478C8E4|nr:hypothetical protein [Heliobacterium mobile]
MRNSMTDEELYLWVRQFQQKLLPAPSPSTYIDLNEGPPSSEQLSALEQDRPPISGELIAFEHLLQAMAEHRWLRVRFGINELLKHYLRSITGIFNVSNGIDPGDVTRRYMEMIQWVFEYGHSPSFPFSESLWTYLSACLESVGITLAGQNQWESLQVLIVETATMGRQAARSGLQTAPLQHFLRRLENTCRDKGEGGREIARLARNLRFNLEV